MTSPEGNEMVLKCALTALNSKLIASHQDLFSPMVVTAVKALYYDAEALDDIKSRMPEDFVSCQVATSISDSGTIRV